MDDKDKRMAEMEALLQLALDRGRSQTWIDRARAILAPPPDPDAGAMEACELYRIGTSHDAPRWGHHNPSGHLGWRAVAAWADKRVAAAERRGRIAGLREAAAASRAAAGWKTVTVDIETLIAKAEADDAA